MAFRDLFRRSEKRGGTTNAAGLFTAAWDVLTNTHNSASGEPINESIALTQATVYACTRVIAESIGSMTLRLYKKMPKGRQEAIDNPLHRMLSVSPNVEMSSPVVWEALAGAMALTGNSYAEILRNKEGSPVGIYPLDPRQTEPVRLPNGMLAYKTGVAVKDGLTRIIASADMLHFPLFSFDGLKGLSPIGQNRNSIGLAIASEKFGSKFFGNNSVPPAFLTPVGDVSEEDLANMRAHWEGANSAANQGRIGVLPSDWKLTQLSMSQEDAQYLETRQFSRTEIASIFRVPPNMVGDTARMSNTNHEQQSLTFVTDTLRPYLVRIEREIQRKLLPTDGSLFAEFDVSERLRGDFATTMQGFATGKQWGFYSTNDVLEKLGENPIGPEGDLYWAPVNMMNAATMLDTEPVLVQPIPDPNAPASIPADKPNEAPTEQQRSLFDAYVPAFTGLFNDAIGRVTARSKRDLESISPILTPVLESIVSIVTTEARSQFKLPDTWKPSDKVVRDYLKSAASRADSWTVDNREQSAGAELSKAFRCIHIGLFRDAGAAVATRSNTHE
ncbi:phage portal protein [Tunturiibacter psychrotolerans]|uniref:phage portal protein n=1 Tax=Tunturiibacter psychrotolerans TaxID=3069686 RepID=UPI003D1F0082